MSDQHICVRWDQVPLGPNLVSPLQIESPIVEPGLPGAAVEFHPINDYLLVLKIVTVSKEILAYFSVILKAEIMVAGDDNLVGGGGAVCRGNR